MHNSAESPSPARATPQGVASFMAGDVEVKDGVVVYRGTRPFEELEFPDEAPADAEDYEWAQQDPRVQQEYGGLVIAVRGRRVWGAGKTARAAHEQARTVPGCPPPDELLFVIVSGPG